MMPRDASFSESYTFARGCFSRLHIAPVCDCVMCDHFHHFDVQYFQSDCRLTGLWSTITSLQSNLIVCQPPCTEEGKEVEGCMLSDVRVVFLLYLQRAFLCRKIEELTLLCYWYATYFIVLRQTTGRRAVWAPLRVMKKKQ